jgi:hypothetical protein
MSHKENDRYMEDLIENDPPEVDILEENQRPLKQETVRDLEDGRIVIVTIWTLNDPKCPFFKAENGQLVKKV